MENSPDPFEDVEDTVIRKLRPGVLVQLERYTRNRDIWGSESRGEQFLMSRSLGDEHVYVPGLQVSGA